MQEPPPLKPLSSKAYKKELTYYHNLIEKLINNMEKVIRGKRQVLEYLLTTLIAGGHLLIEDVPGLGKTTLAKTIAHLIAIAKTKKAVAFQRIQCTPDLLPYDITGVDIFDPEHKRFRFLKGPVFTHILLVDEINRTTPKVQSALLEVMAENQVTVGKNTYIMDDLFFVVATQNPVEIQGTYPLPQAQLDRFFMKIAIGYPDEEVEIGIVREDPSLNIMPKIKPICSIEDILGARRFAKQIYCDERLIQTAVRVSAATRQHRGVELGASPRCSIMLLKALRAYALIKGRGYVIDQDLVKLAPLVVSHRLKFKDIRHNAHEFIKTITLSLLSKINYKEKALHAAEILSGKKI